MRVTCPHCAKRFDVAKRKVLDEARRIREQSAGETPEDQGHNGNVLDPADKEAARQRAEAIARRVRQR